MRRSLLFIALLLPLAVFAQQEDCISNHEDSIRQTASQNRRFLLDQFYAARLDSVSILLDSLDMYHPDEALLFPAERLLLYFWIERYEAIDSLALHFDDFCEEVTANPPLEQTIWNVLSYYSQDKVEMLVAWIDQTECSDEVFDFRVRLLKTLVQNELQEQSFVNQEIQSLIAQYSFQEDEISTITREQDEYKEPDRPWQFGIGMGLGTATASGRIANYFSSIVGVSLDVNINYHRWYFSLLLQFAFSQLKLDIPNKKGDGVWKAGELANITQCGLSLGYSVMNNRFFRMTPYIGMAVSECVPDEKQIEKDDTLKKAGLKGGFSNILGLDTDIKLSQIIHPKKNKDILTSLNIRLNYVPSMFNKANSRYSGNLLFITVGVRLNVSGN